LVVRRYFNGHKDSTYAQLKWATHRLGVANLWQCSKSPLEMTFKPTGQKIIFRGMDDPQSITSIAVEKGVLCWVWVEEAFQIESEDAFNKLDMSIRGEMPQGYFKQITLTFNPWSSEHWLKKRFFDTKSNSIFARTTNYQCNEWLDDADIAIFNEMQMLFPRRYEVEGLGNWGIAEGLIYENWRKREFDYTKFLKERPDMKALFGMDFGYTNDPTAFIALLQDENTKELYIFDEHYEKGMLNDDIAKMITKKGFAKERIIADSAEPKSIAELKKLGILRVRSAKKGPDSVRNGIDRVNSYRIYVHPRCHNVMMELSNYIWDTNREGRQLNQPVDKYNHLMDALRYATEEHGGLTVLR
ncbi:MAG: PBSX family phage terminase large subunit, partial [Oscillospiraceae bacterium]